MNEAISARSGVTQPHHRLPLARWRQATEQRERSHRPAPVPPATCADTIETLDRSACLLANREARCRLVQARIVAALLKRRLWRSAGFVRLSHYAPERLGVSARSVEEDARVVQALDLLPDLRAALETGAIRWTHARLLAGVATSSTELEWLQLALGSTTRKLAELVKSARAGKFAIREDATSDGGDAQPTTEGPDACVSRDADSSAGPDDGESADPLVLWTIGVTRAGRKLWRSVGELASRMCGTDVPASRVAEAVAAEAMSWPVWEPPFAEQLPPRALRERVIDNLNEGPDRRSAAPSTLRALDSELESLLFDLDNADAHEIDRRLCSVRRTMQHIDTDLGAVLRKIADQSFHRHLGFSDLRLYSEGRLGICGSKAMALVRLDRQCALRSPALLRAYREGRVTWLAATVLLPVISPRHQDAWVERAERVTLRRLEADVSWALDRADDVRGNPEQAPPPLDLDAAADALSRCDKRKGILSGHPRPAAARATTRIGVR